MEMVDQVLAADDKNKDGFVDYMEFVKSHRSPSTKQKSVNQKLKK